MASKKTTRRALFTSVISLILCFAMLAGTTYAWFTDSVESGRNVITAGNLDVELYANGEKVDSSTELFDAVDPELWEPGAVAYENLQVKNVGTLALKYNLELNVLEETTVEGGYKLSDVIKVGYVGEAVSGTREEVLAKVTEWQNLSTYNLNMYGKELAAKTDDSVFALVLYWAPNDNVIDNLYNLNNGKSGEMKLEIGVNLLATQLEAESDSFGKDYDEDAYNLPVVNDAEELAAALANGESVKLGKDIELDESITIPDGAEVTLNLNGKTLSGSILAPNANLTIENGELKNENPDVSAIEIHAGKLTLTDVNITSARHAVRIDGNVTATINGGTYGIVGSGATQHAVNVSGNANVTINGGTFTGPRGTTADSGSAVTARADSTVVINGGNFSGGKNNTLSGAGTLTVKGGTFDQAPTTYLADGYQAVDNGDGTYTVMKGDAYVRDSEELVAAINAGKTYIVLAKGTFEFDWANRDLLNGVTIVGTSAEDSTLQFTGYGPDSNDWSLNGLTLENVTVVDRCQPENSTYSYYHSYFYVSGLKATNVVFETGVKTVNDESTFTICTFVSGYYWNYSTQDYSTEEMYGLVANGDVAVDGCSFTGFRGIDVSAACNVTVNNSTFNLTNIEKPAINVKNAGATVTVDGAAYASTSDDLQAALTAGGNVVLATNVENNNVTVSNSYGKTGYTQTNGGVLDGNGYTMNVTGANGTWDSAINTTGGTIKNITVTGAFRGIFINHNSEHSEKVILENVIIDGTIYTISCDQGTNQGLKATNCTFNGWTSYAATLGATEFIDCTFGEGRGYAYCRPYADTTFTNCVFEEGYEFDATECTSTFINCYVGDTLITSENVVALLGDYAESIIVQNG